MKEKWRILSAIIIALPRSSGNDGKFHCHGGTSLMRTYIYRYISLLPSGYIFLSLGLLTANYKCLLVLLYSEAAHAGLMTIFSLLFPSSSFSFCVS